MPSDASTFDFGMIADSYDRWYQTPLGRAYDLLEKRAVARMLPRAAPDARLLDLGCGTGHWSAFFATLGFKVTGMDIAPEMIAAARAKHIAGASFDVADAHKLPFDDGEFDVATAITTLRRSPPRSSIHCHSPSSCATDLLGSPDGMAVTSTRTSRFRKPVAIGAAQRSRTASSAITMACDKSPRLEIANSANPSIAPLAIWMV